MTQPNPHTSSRPTRQPPWSDGVIQVPSAPGPVEPPRPRPAGGAPSEPMKRPRAVWTVSIALTVFGLLGMGFSWLLLSVLGSHGEHVNPALKVLLFIQLLLSGTQVGSGIALLPGYEVARRIAIPLCVLNLIGGIVTLLTGAITAVGTIAVNGLLIRQLCGDDVREWCERHS